MARCDLCSGCYGLNGGIGPDAASHKNRISPAIWPDPVTYQARGLNKATADSPRQGPGMVKADRSRMVLGIALTLYLAWPM